jgi:dihydroorotate dehydrogenase subfamily 2
MYKKVIKPILFKFNPEKVHEIFVSFGEIIGYFAVTRFLVRFVYGYKVKDLSKIVDGIEYKTPIVMSAGFDYNGRLIKILPNISLGGVEVGSVTAKKCEGNPKPNLTRLPKTKSIIVNKGLKNNGVDSLIKRLKNRRKSDFVVGISIAKTNCKECVSIEEGIEDYLYSFKRLNEENIGDYYTINISCPNAYGGETFTEASNLKRLFNTLDKVSCKKPIYVKMPISIDNKDYIKLLNVLDKHRVSGVVIGNLQKDYSYINEQDGEYSNFIGGLSGMPCQTRSNELIALTKKQLGDRFTIIGCGGIFSYKDAQNKMDAGADLVQLITGIIYEGPGLIKKICEKL